MIGAQGVQAREEFGHMGTAQRRCWRTHVWAHALPCDGRRRRRFGFARILEPGRLKYRRRQRCSAWLRGGIRNWCRGAGRRRAQFRERDSVHERRAARCQGHRRLMRHRPSLSACACVLALASPLAGRAHVDRPGFGAPLRPRIECPRPGRAIAHSDRCEPLGRRRRRRRRRQRDSIAVTACRTKQRTGGRGVVPS